MGNIFSAAEIIEMGIEIERNGRDFYNSVAGLSENAKVSKIFSFLAEEEGRHIQRFKDMLTAVKNYRPSEAYTEEYFSYLRALSEEHVFTKKDKGIGISKNIKTDLEAVSLGIKLEQESILFYTGMKRVVLEGEQGLLDRIIEEENRHLGRLTELKESL